METHLVTIFLQISCLTTSIFLEDIKHAANRGINEINTNSVLDRYTRDDPGYTKRSDGSDTDEKDMHLAFAESLDRNNIKENSRNYSKHPHHPGSERNRILGENIAQTWKDYGLDKVEKFEYDVLLTYPEKPAEIILKDGDNVVKLLVVVDEPLFDSKVVTKEPVVYPFSAFSKGGTIEGEIVYCNYGSEKDYELLRSLDIKLENKIFLVRWGKKGHRKDLVKDAIKNNASALILFTDPAESYPGGEYPNGWMSSLFGVKRGSIGTNAKYLGDLLSEGYPAKEGYFRDKMQNVEKYLNNITVQPISSYLAYELIDFMDDDSIPVPKHFKGALKVNYNLQSKKGKKVTLKLYNKFNDSKILVVCGTLYGKEEPDRYVLIGNHRDAWTYGAGDPVSGTAIMSEIARVLGSQKKKYRPRRSIMLCSWDGEEQGILGSAEWSEEHVNFISKKVVAYLNVDISVCGNYTVEIKSSPLLAKSLFECSKKIVSPDDEKIDLFTDMCHRHALLKNESQDLKEPDYKESGMGWSDTRAFMKRFSLPASDYRYTFNKKDFPLVITFPQYHTSYDNFKWMTTFIDPTFKYHLTIGKLWLLHTLSLADSTLLPLDLVAFVDHLEKDFLKLAKNQTEEIKNDLKVVKESINELKSRLIEFDKMKNNLDTTKINPIKLRLINDIIGDFSKQFVAQTGTKGAPVVYMEEKFVELKEVMNNIKEKKRKDEKDNWDSARRELTLIRWCIDTAAKSLDLSELEFDTE